LREGKKDDKKIFDLDESCDLSIGEEVDNAFKDD